MSIIAKYSQTPNETKVYRVDYSGWLDTTTGGTPETIVSASSSLGPVTVPPLVAVTAILVTLTDVSLTVSGGLAGETYTVSIIANTSGGQTKEDCIEIQVVPACV